jgi:hypothetical protein
MIGDGRMPETTEVDRVREIFYQANFIRDLNI